MLFGNAKRSRRLIDGRAFPELSGNSHSKNPVDYVFTAISTLITKEAEFLLVLMWTIWNNRNNGLAEKRRRKDIEVVDWAGRYLEEFQNAKDRLNLTTDRPSSVPSWHAPPPGTLEVSVAATVSGQGSHFGLGGVA